MLGLPSHPRFVLIQWFSEYSLLGRRGWFTGLTSRDFWFNRSRVGHTISKIKNKNFLFRKHFKITGKVVILIQWIPTQPCLELPVVFLCVWLLFVSFFFWPHSVAHGLPWPGVELTAPAVEARSLNPTESPIVNLLPLLLSLSGSPYSPLPVLEMDIMYYAHFTEGKN